MSLIQDLSQQTAFVPEDTPLGQIARLMATSASGVIGITRNGLAVGTITDHDLLKRAVALGWDLSKFSAKHVMELRPVMIEWLSDDSDLIDAAIIMRRTKARNAIVTRGGTPIGVISFNSLCKHNVGG